MTISDINKDLDKYLSSRREKADWSFFSNKPKAARKPKKVEDVPEMVAGEVHVIQDDSEPGFWGRLFRKEKPIVGEDLSEDEMERLEAMEMGLERMDVMEQEHPEATMIIEEERDSLLDRFYSLFRGYEHQHKVENRLSEAAYVAEEVVPQLDADVKEVLKIIHGWLARLPKRQRDEFKKSNDFQKYKKLLETYGIAKK